MKDELKLLGVLGICLFLAFAFVGLAPQELAASFEELVKSDDQKILALDNYVPPAWLGREVSEEPQTISTTQASKEVVTRKERAVKERSNFKDSATNDDSNGKIIVARKKERVSPAVTASIFNSRSSRSQSVVDSQYGSLLAVALLLMVLVFLARAVGRKKRRLSYASPATSRRMYTVPHTSRYSNYSYQRNY